VQIRLLITIFILLLTCLAPSVFGQDIQFSNIKYIVEDGLPHREINTIHKDSKGYLWVGTPQGIARFDGYEFKLFDRLSEGFINQDIWRILEDADGWFWLLPEKPGENIDIWHPDKNILTSFEEKFGGFSDIPECHPMEWIVSSADTSLIAYLDASRLFRFHPNTGVKIIEIRNGSLDLETHCTLLCADDHIWAVSPNNTISKIHPSGMIVQRIVHDQPVEMERAFQNRQLPLIYFQYDEKGNNTSFLLDKEGNSISLGLDFKYPFLIQTERLKGIEKNLIYDREKFFEFSGEQLEKLRDTVYWSDGSIHRAIYFDDDGFLWTGNDFGLEKIHIHNRFFKTYLAQESNRKAIRGIYVDEDHIFINSEHYGPSVINKSSNNRWEPDVGDHRFGYFAIEKLRNGHLISSQHSELLVFNEEFELIDRSPSNRRIWTILELDDGNLLVGAQKGIHIWDTQSKELLPYDSYNAHGILAGAFVTHIERGEDDLLYICSDKGFFIMDEEEGVLSRYGDSEYADLNIGTDVIYHYLKDESGLWLATGGSGLMRINENTENISRSEISYFQREDGLSNNVIYAVYPDNNNNLWLTSDLGLMRFNKDNYEVVSFYKEDGIPNNEFNRLAHFQTENGELYFGGIDGLIRFHPDTLISQSSNRNSTLVLSGISGFDTKLNELVDLNGEYSSTGVLNVHPYQSFVTINASLLNFKEVDKNRYYHRFKDNAADWQWSYDNQLRFDGLKYGEHTLQIRAKDVRGNWSKNELNIKLCVLRPVYLQYWFIALVTLIVSCILYSLFVYRTRSLIKNKERLEYMVQERTEKLRKDQELILEQASKLKNLESLKSRFFANMSHELKTPLSLIMGPLRKLDQDSTALSVSDKKLISTARRNSEKLLNLVDEILDISRLERSEIILDPEPILFKDFLTEKYQAACAMADYKDIIVELHDKTESDSAIMVDRGKLSKIVDNYISNAIKFTRTGGHIKIVANEKEKLFRISVIDDGEGVHKDDLPYIFNRFYRSKYSSNLGESGSGIGLSLVQELAELLGGSVGVESTQGQGSCFYFEFEKIYASSKLKSKNDQISKGGGVESNSKVLIAEDIGDKAAVPNADDSSYEEEKAKILIVEDNPDLRWYLDSILTAQYEVVTKANGKQAIDYLHEAIGDVNDTDYSKGLSFPVKLIITDLRMPVMDGFELIQNLKSHDVLRHIPCIVLTARSSAEARLKALRVGVDDYLIKPFLEEELIARVANRVNNFNERMLLIKEEIKNEDNILAGLGNIAQADSEWLQKVEGLFDKSLSESQLKMDWVASQLHMSERHFQRKLKLLTGLTPSSYQREMRLIKARDMIQTGKFKSVKEVSHAVGISSTKYFSKLFKERFGILPSQYQTKEKGLI